MQNSDYQDIQEIRQLHDEANSEGLESHTGSTSSSIVLKISMNNVIKRIPVEWEPSLEELIILCRERFKEVLTRPDFKLKYFDRQNDLVWVSTEDELQVAFKHSSIMEDNVRVIRFYICPHRGAMLANSNEHHHRKKYTDTPKFIPKVEEEIGWYGDCTREAAERYLRGSPPKTFLTRWNKNANCFVLSYVDDLRFNHIGFIFPLEAGGVIVKRTDNTQIIYDHFEDYVHAMQKTKHIKDPRTRVEVKEGPTETDYASFASISSDDWQQALQIKGGAPQDDDYFYLDDLHFLQEGLLVYKEGETHGKVIFSLNELPLDTKYVTENKNFITRVSENAVQFQSRARPNQRVTYEF